MHRSPPPIPVAWSVKSAPFALPLTYPIPAKIAEKPNTQNRRMEIGSWRRPQEIPRNNACAHSRRERTVSVLMSTVSILCSNSVFFCRACMSMRTPTAAIRMPANTCTQKRFCSAGILPASTHLPVA